MGCEHDPKGYINVVTHPQGGPLGPCKGWPSPLDMLLEAAFVVEDLVAEVAVFLLPIEQEPRRKSD